VKAVKSSLYQITAIICIKTYESTGIANNTTNNSSQCINSRMRAQGQNSKNESNHGG